METQNASTWSRKAKRHQKKKVRQSSQKPALDNMPEQKIPKSAAVESKRTPKDTLTAANPHPTASKASVIMPPSHEEAADLTLEHSSSDQSGSNGTLSESVAAHPITPAEAVSTASVKSSELPSRPLKTEPCNTGSGVTYIHSIGSLM